MRFPIFLITSFFALVAASNVPSNDLSDQPLQGSDTFTSPRDADIDKTCRRLRTLTQLNKIAHNETLLDTIDIRDKLTQQRIDWIKSNSADITAKLNELTSNSTLAAECDTINAQRETARQCKILQMLERLVNSTNGQDGVDRGPAADLFSDEQKQNLQQKFEKAELKLQQLRSNATLIRLCQGDVGFQQSGAIGSQLVDNSGAISMTKSTASSQSIGVEDIEMIMTSNIECASVHDTPIPSGMATFNFGDPPPGLNLSESRTVGNSVVAIILFVLSGAFVALRLFTRTKLKREQLGCDDYLIVAGLALNAGNLACCIAGGFFGLGRHIWSLGPEQMRHITIITFAYVFVYAWSVCVIKLSILALYRRIFGINMLGWFCVGMTAAYLITNHVVLPLYTRPLSYYWDQWNGAQGEILVNEAKFYLGAGIFNLLGDVCILCIPISHVVKLQMEKTQKVAICFIFLLGSFRSVCFASLYRIITIVRLMAAQDISWKKSDVFIWSSVEPSIGIISGCLPTLQPFFIRTTHALAGAFGATPSHVPEQEGIESRETASRTVNAWTERWGRTRPAEEDLCLTTTTVCGSANECDGITWQDFILGPQVERRITMTHEFVMNESIRSRGS
ncbi:hypothetical protein BKA58DRAFT_419471 [Alternaria rosae]|uniref:uncharacterized protein n=1 Tax=Alternaria rosae TaxID=1187941 RepID=UPI001E8DAB73|nr:uncharacterized protein BKA58DRAFT_419471 [Alternaria rosae]KAH6876100.1 hypothetical protein BKA58DRAFT_419471 [Alternaria rosae]